MAWAAAALGQEAVGTQRILDVAPITAREAVEHGLAAITVANAQAGLAVIMGGTAGSAVRAMPVATEGLGQILGGHAGTTTKPIFSMT